jgi:hypothetical protein
MAEIAIRKCPSLGDELLTQNFQKMARAFIFQMMQWRSVGLVSRL